MALALFPGTFDPFTLGHLDVLTRALRLFSAVEVTVAVNSGKQPLFSLEERCALIEACAQGLEGVSVVPFEGLLAAHARRQGAVALVRGVRGVTDFDYERALAAANRKLVPGLETVFVLPAEAHAFTSSTIVRDVHRWGGDVAAFVPPPVAEALAARRNPTS